MAKGDREIPVTPLYSPGTAEMDGKNNDGEVEGPKGREKVPDPLGYLAAPTE